MRNLWLIQRINPESNRINSKAQALEYKTPRKIKPFQKILEILPEVKGNQVSEQLLGGSL